MMCIDMIFLYLGTTRCGNIVFVLWDIERQCGGLGCECGCQRGE
jgi:hypothetical protein